MTGTVQAQLGVSIKLPPTPAVPVRAARAFYRGYVQGSRRAGQVRLLHVIRDTPVAHHGHQFHALSREYGWCGTSAGRHRNSDAVVISPLPGRPPDGLRWCASCTGHLAEHYGLLAEVAASLAAYDPELSS